MAASTNVSGSRLGHNVSSRAFHDALKNSTELWDRLTTPVGLMDDGAGNLLDLANCRVCLSTIARPAKPQR